MIPAQTVIDLELQVTGNVTAQPMVRRYRSLPFRGMGIEAGGRIDMLTATTADVTIVDSNGVVLYPTTTITADASISPVPRGVRGPLLVTVANISNAAHTLRVSFQVKR